MDSRVQQAREHHRRAQEHDALARQHRAQRDDLIRSLYGAGGWSYKRLAKAIGGGLTPELVAKIVKPQKRGCGACGETKAHSHVRRRDGSIGAVPLPPPPPPPPWYP